MRQLILVSLIIPLSLASSCSEITSCYECDSLLDTNGDQACSWCRSSSSCVPHLGLECIFGSKITNKNDCPIAIPPGLDFNETLSRKTLLMCYSSFGNSVQRCLNKDPRTADFMVTKEILALCDNTGKDTCFGYTAVSAMERAIVITFRGTLGNEQLLQEAEYALFKKKVEVPGGGSVCKYFYDGFMAVWDGGMSAELNRLKSLYPDYELWVIGHSMGAAIATVAANVIASTQIYSGEMMKVMTFGEPRVGDRDFAAAHDSLLPFKYRVTHRQDMVTHLPPKGFLGYRHHRYEAWYNNDMNDIDNGQYIVCLEPEDNGCSDQNLLDLSWPDHSHYYGHFTEDYLGNLCSA